MAGRHEDRRGRSNSAATMLTAPDTTSVRAAITALAGGA